MQNAAQKKRLKKLPRKSWTSVRGTTNNFSHEVNNANTSETAQFNVWNLVRPFMCFMDRDTAYIHEHEKKQRTVTQGL